MHMSNKLFTTVIATAIAVSAIVGCTAIPATTATDSSLTDETEVMNQVATETEAEMPIDSEEIGEKEGEIDDITVVLMDERGLGANADAVINAMNDITEKSIGVHANIQFVDAGTFATQVGLMISGGEPIDVLALTPIPPVDFAGLITNGQAMDITDYLQEDAPELYEMMKDYLGAVSIGGRIYGIPTYRNYAAEQYVLMRQDILEEIGMLEKAQNLSSWSELTEIYKAVYDNTEVSPVGALNRYVDVGRVGGDSFEEIITYDTLGDNLHLVCTDREGNVSLLPEDEAYKNGREIVKEWYDAGYIHKDSTISDEHADTLTKAGVIFSSFQPSSLGVEVAKKEATGYDEVCVIVNHIYIESSKITKFGMVVPVTSSEPEAALRWLNALYTDPALANLITWGVEGRDYVVNDGVASFPEGVSADTVPYHGADFMYGNFFNDYPWQGSSADFREISKGYLAAAPVSPYLGFAVDQSEIANTIASLNNVYQTYVSNIGCGKYSSEEYDQYISELKNAGVDDYLANYQKQLTEWIFANN